MAVVCFDQTTSLIPIPLLLLLLLPPPSPYTFHLIHFTPPYPSTFLLFQLIVTRLLLPWFLLLPFPLFFPTYCFSSSYFFTYSTLRQTELPSRVFIIIPLLLPSLNSSSSFLFLLDLLSTHTHPHKPLLTRPRSVYPHAHTLTFTPTLFTVLPEAQVQEWRVHWGLREGDEGNRLVRRWIERLR